jgi:hypothetical protein
MMPARMKRRLQHLREQRVAKSLAFLSTGAVSKLDLDSLDGPVGGKGPKGPAESLGKVPTCLDRPAKCDTSPHDGGS